MRVLKAVGTLVIPIFGFYYVTMANTGMLLYTIRHLFIRGKAKNHVFGSKVLSFSWLFWVFVQSKMTIAHYATIFIIRVFGTHLWRSL